MKLFSRITPLVIFAGLLFACIPSAHAQDISVYFGVGSATDGAGPANTVFLNCCGDSTVYTTPSLGGAWGTIGGDFMFNHWMGVGAEYSFQFAQSPYAGPSATCACSLNYNTGFYDFNAVFHPFHYDRVVPEFQAGLGGATVQFYLNQSQSDLVLGSQNFSTYFGSSNHFALHGAAAAKIYIRPHIFIKPQFDIRWVDNFFQFNSDWVPEYSVAVGFSSGRR